MCRSPFALFIVYFRIQKSNQSKRIHRWPFRPTSVIVLCFHFIFAGCLLVFEQYLVKWECSLSATAVQEILISARYPAEISFLILFYWKYSFYFFIRFSVPAVYETLQVAFPLPWWFMTKLMVIADLWLCWLQEQGLCSFSCIWAKYRCEHKARSHLCWYCLTDTRTSLVKAKQNPSGIAALNEYSYYDISLSLLLFVFFIYAVET